jgi:hypothetical protein
MVPGFDPMPYRHSSYQFAGPTALVAVRRENERVSIFSAAIVTCTGSRKGQPALGALEEQNMRKF